MRTLLVILLLCLPVYAGHRESPIKVNLDLYQISYQLRVDETYRDRAKQDLSLLMISIRSDFDRETNYWDMVEQEEEAEDNYNNCENAVVNALYSDPVYQKALKDGRTALVSKMENDALSKDKEYLEVKTSLNDITNRMVELDKKFDEEIKVNPIAIAAIKRYEEEEARWSAQNDIFNATLDYWKKHK